MAANPAYAKDLGYLDKFIARLEADAASLPADRREQALSLLAAERTQWSRIMALLAGEPVQADAPSAPPPQAPPVVRSPAPTAPAAPPQSPRPGLTVGSLIGKL